MKILLTGASGFIGNRVGRALLADGHEVLAVCRSDESQRKAAQDGFTIVVGDLAQTDLLSELAASADGVVHTAFGHPGSWGQAVAQDIDALSALGAGLERTGRCLVVASGGGVLGETRGLGAVGADYRGDPRSPYAPRQKADVLCQQLLNQGVRAVTVRIPLLVFGSGGGGLVPPLMADATEAGASSYVGDGGNLISKVHIDDAARAFALAVSSEGASGTVQLADARSVSGRQLAEAIAEKAQITACRSISPEAATARFGPIVGTLMAWWNELDASATYDQLGWRPREISRLAEAL